MLGALQWPFEVAIAVLGGCTIPAPERVLLTPDVTDLVAVPAAAVRLWLQRSRGLLCWLGD